MKYEIQNIPQLRFKGFEAEWEFEKLQSRIKSIDSGWSPQCEEYPSTEDEWGVLKTTSVVWEGFNENANKKLPEKLNPRPELQVSINDILITRAGPTSRVGVTVHVNKVRPRLMLSDKLIRLRSNENCSSLFLAISLSNSSSQKQLVSKSSGLAESQTNISQKILLNTKLSFPVLPEQQKIASFISALDEKILQLSRKKELLEQYKKGVMQQLFSGKLRFKDENGKEYIDWEEKKLGEVSTKKSSNISANKIEDNIGEFIIYGASGILKKVDFYKEENDYISIVKDGAGVGRLLYCKGKSSVLGTMEIISPKQNIDTYFLYCLLSNIDFVKYVTGSTIPHIYFKDYSGEICGIPSFPEQQKIANFLSSIDAKIESTNQQINQTQSFKKGLLQQLFV
jgi:type I restriction enzyme S subunit